MNPKPACTASCSRPENRTPYLSMYTFTLGFSRLAGLLPRCGAIFAEQAASTQSYFCEEQTGAASAGTLDQQDVIELSDSDSHSEELKHEVPSVSSGSQHVSHAGWPDTPDNIQRKSARIISAPKRFHQAGCTGRCATLPAFVQHGCDYVLLKLLDLCQGPQIPQQKLCI